MNWRLWASLVFMAWVGMQMNGLLRWWDERCYRRELARQTEGMTYVGFWVRETAPPEA